MKVAYIAGPYRAASQEVLSCNIQVARQVAVEYWRQGFAVICPHANSCFMDEQVGDERILLGDLELLGRCDVIVMLPRWRESEGARAELSFARECGMEIRFHGDGNHEKHEGHEERQRRKMATTTAMEPQMNADGRG